MGTKPLGVATAEGETPAGSLYTLWPVAELKKKGRPTAAS
jgi:hypothetical protein